MTNLKKIIVGTYLFTVFYTVIRYHVFGGVLWKDFFIFTINKILIFSAVIFLYFLTTRFLDKQAKDSLKKTITVSIVLHIIFSTIILKPYYLNEPYRKHQFVSRKFRSGYLSVTITNRY